MINYRTTFPKIRQLLNLFSYLIVSLQFLVVAVSAEEPPTLKIGVIQSLTGIASENGTTARRSIELAASELSTPELQIKLIFEDDRSDSKSAVAGFKRLQSQKVDGIIGPTWSATSNAVLPLAESAGIPVVNTTTLPESIDSKLGPRVFFSTAISTTAIADTFARYLRQTSPKTAAVVSTNNLWGEAQRIAITAVLKNQNVQIVDEITSATFDQNDWGAMIPRLNAKNPEMIAIFLNRGDVMAFLRRAVEGQLTAPIFTSYHLFDAWREAKDKNLFNGACFPYPFEQLAAAKAFVSLYQKKYGEEPLIFADSSFDGVMLLHTAAKFAKATGAPLLEAMKMVEFKGVGGDRRYNPDSSFSGGKSSLTCIVGGKPLVVQ